MTVNVLFPARITNIAAHRAIVRAITRAKPAATVHPANRARASRGVLRDKSCAMANASPHPRITSIVALLGTAQVQTKVRLAATAHPANRALASRDASRDRCSVTVNALFRARITNIAAHRAIARAITKAKPAATAHLASRALASRDVLLDRFCAMANASPRARTICIAAHQAIARATTRARLAVTVHPANRALASRDA